MSKFSSMSLAVGKTHSATTVQECERAQGTQQCGVRPLAQPNDAKTVIIAIRAELRNGANRIEACLDGGEIERVSQQH